MRRIISARVAAAAMMAVCCLHGAGAADWPQWRGPTRNGIAADSPKLLDRWPTNGPALLWKSDPIPGSSDSGRGSVVVANGRAFLYLNRYTEKSKDEERVRQVFRDVLADLGKSGTFPTNDLAALTKTQDKVHTFQDIAKALDPFAGAGKGWVAGVKSDVERRIFDITDNILCLDVATGKRLWEAAFPAADGAKHKIYTYWGASGTPAIADGRCYIAGSAGLYCLDVRDGSLVWQERTGFTSSSPLVEEGVVYVALPDGLSARDAGNGRLIWKSPAIGGGDGSYGKTVVPWKSGGRSCLVGLGHDKMFCLEAGTGQMLWSEDRVGGGEGSSTPGISGDYVVVQAAPWTGPDKGTKGFRITPEKAELLWTVPPEVWRNSSPIVYEDNAYIVSSDWLRCLDMKTGAIRWQRKDLSNHFSSPILADGKIICPVGGRDHNYYLLFRATPDKFEELGSLGRAPNGLHVGACCTSPALADGRLCLRLETCVACYDLRAR